MSRYVLKFGGSSLAGDENLRAAAQKLADLHCGGHEVIGVLSARGNRTDQLLAQAHTLHPSCGGRELDALLSTGEQEAVSQCAMVLQAMGLSVVSLCGWQTALVTDKHHGDAKILHLAGDRVKRELQAGKIVLVAGFQGVTEDGDITTLGRGGSDTTAVALAAFLDAERCLIYTDVDGVYDRDPRKYPDARKLPQISYDSMLAMAQTGAKVLHAPCVALAKQYHVPLEVRSSFSTLPGTVIVDGGKNRCCDQETALQ